MIAPALTSVAIVVSWAFAGYLGYIWYRRLEVTSDSQVPECAVMLLLGPVGLCMLSVCAPLQWLEKRCRSNSSTR